MRYLLPTMMLAAAIAAGSGVALAQQPPRRPHKRIGSYVSLHISRHNVVSGQRIVLWGRVHPRGSHRLKLVVRGPRGTAVGATSRRSGAFAIHWRPRRPGSYRVRAFGIHDRRMRGSRSAARRITAYRHAAASYYGPGFYGGALACGGTLQPGTLGVANRTLPCGARVKLLYRGRTVTVRVVDRGPYVAGREFDLTAATKARLHFPDVGVLLSNR